MEWQGSWGYLGKLEFEALNITWSPISIAPSIHRASTTGFNVSALVRVPPVLAHGVPLASRASLASHWATGSPEQHPETVGAVGRPAVSFVGVPLGKVCFVPRGQCGDKGSRVYQLPLS